MRLFTKISFEGNEIIFSGEALTNESFAKFITTLTGEPLFTEITINTLEKDDSTKSLIFTTTVQLATKPGKSLLHEQTTILPGKT